MLSFRLLAIFSLLGAYARGEECGCNQIPSVDIVNDARLANGMKEVRDEFLRRQVSSNFSRLSATILVREGVTSVWKRGSVDGTLLAYPASTVKLMYMYSAMDWCKKHSQPVDCLDRYVRPMVVVSSNLDTGYVLDAISNTTNLEDLTSVNDTRWDEWYYRRLSTERLLKELKLYENQVIRSKTYPTNSGQSPVGSESVLPRSPGQRNFLQSCCSASFMLYLMKACPSNELQYMKGLLYRSLESDHTTFGNGLPAGTRLYSKVGNAYDTIEEIAYMVLPDGREIILSAFSNGYQRRSGDFYILGRFAEMVLEKFSLNSSSTHTFTTDQETIYTCTNSSTKHNSSLPKDTMGQSFITFNGSCTIHPVLPERGVYTVSLWNPSAFDASTARINVAATDALNITDRDDGFIYDQQTSVSRWVSVGDFLLGAGRQDVYVEALAGEAVFNAIRFSLHPPLQIDSSPDSKSATYLCLPSIQLIVFAIFFFLFSV